MKLTQIDFANLCRAHGPRLIVPGLEPVRVLWAIGGKETSFGDNIVPRHENGYCFSSPAYKADARLREMTKVDGCAAHSSYGPWQILYYNALITDKSIALTQLLYDANVCARVTVDRLNHVIQAQGLVTLREIADAWNSGNGKDRNIPEEYIKAVEANYLTPMPQGEPA